jgi:hypothetical protein
MSILSSEHTSAQGDQLANAKKGTEEVKGEDKRQGRWTKVEHERFIVGKLPMV